MGKNINSLLMEGKFNEAYALIEDSISKEKKVDDLLLQHRIIKYWINHLEVLNKIKNDYEKGLAYLNEWSEFLVYVEKHKMHNVDEINAIHYFVHNKAVIHLLNAKQEKNTNDISLLLSIAYCFKEIAKYDEAIETLKYAYKLDHNSQIMFLMADCYYLKGDIEIAKLFFKEVFFFENSLTLLDFDVISCDKIFEIIEIAKKNGFEEYEAIEWVPIYGILNNFFDIRRELTEQEINKIKQEIIELEKIYYVDVTSKSNLEPVLIKKYIILVEYFTIQIQDKNKREQYLNKIKNINPVLYEELIKKI